MWLVVEDGEGDPGDSGEIGEGSKGSDEGEMREALSWRKKSVGDLPPEG